MDKNQSTFINFDIVSFYPSITEQLLNSAIQFAEQHIDITREEKNIIIHARKSTLHTDNSTWTKKGIHKSFDVTMGSYDGAEVCELVGIYILNQIKQKLPHNIGLYRDDGLAIIRESPKNVKKAKKQLCSIFKNNGLKITIEANRKIINFLDVTLNLTTGSYKPYLKPGNKPTYVHTSSNHPPSIIKNIPAAINKRLSAISYDEESFKQRSGSLSSRIKG